MTHAVLCRCRCIIGYDISILFGFTQHTSGGQNEKHHPDDLRPNAKNVMHFHELEHGEDGRSDTYKDRALNHPSLVEEEAAVLVTVLRTEQSTDRPVSGF